MHTWGEFNKELFRKFLDYEEEPDRLKKLVEDAFLGAGVSFDYPMDLMDPISPVSMASSWGPSKRLRIYKHLASVFGLEEIIPDDDFRGMPTFLPQKGRFIPVTDNPTISRQVWEFLKIALDYSEGTADNNQLAEAFDNICTINGVASRTASIALFWIDFEKYVTLDNTMCDFLRHRMGYEVNGNFNGEEYIRRCNDIKERLNEWDMGSFNDISAIAWDEKKDKNKRLKSDSSSNHGGSSEKDSSFEDTDDTGINSDVPKNMIFYGPPGTGKTYSARRKAVEIISGHRVSDDRSFNELYRKYVAENKIGMVTFHQSFSYEEFVEGIRPVLNPEDTIPTYEVCNGIFKTFCKAASNATVGYSFDIKDNAMVWKVSLGGTGDNPIRDDCLKNGRIRMDFSEYNGNLSEISLPKALEKFVDIMSVGDIVFSCYSETKIDAIGKVTGDFFIDNTLDGYQKTRSVKWLKIFDEPLDIYEINGEKKMAQAAVYNLSRFSKRDVLSLLGVTVESDNTPRVFIIDEINRGNISRIFGELITLIEESKRSGAEDSAESTLPYSKERFSIPSNIYVIGTMNTADRSLVNLDTALRRRFSFVEMMPESGLLGEVELEDGRRIDLNRMLSEINRRIEVLYDRDHALGHSYFMKVKDLGDLDRVFEEKVVPLLQEYFFDDYEKILRILSVKGRPNVSEFVTFSDSRDVFPDMSGRKMYSVNVPRDNPDQYISLYQDVNGSDDDNSS